MESHLQSAMRLHLDLACAKLYNTEETTRKLMEKFDALQRQLNDTRDNLVKQVMKFDSNQALLNLKLNNIEAKLNFTENMLKDSGEKPGTSIFIWKINNFSDILRQAKSGENDWIESASFYVGICNTESYGYKLKVRLYPNGQGSCKNTHLSVYIIVMKGEYDAILPWPYKMQVKMTLIDQQENPVERENVTKESIPNNDPECYARPVNKEDNAGRGFGKFVSHEILNSRHYLVDDTMFLHVEVGP